jgi:hypothetical protein
VNLPNFFAELKRRNVYRAAVAYGVVAWFLTQLTTQDRRVIPASAFAAFGANSFTPFFMRKLLHNGNDALKGCTVASPPSPLFEIARMLVHFDHVASFIEYANHSIV